MTETNGEQKAASASHHTNVKYESNPFLVSITGLMTMLKVNPVPSLLLGIILMLIVVGGMFASFILILIPIIGWLVILGVMLAIAPFIIGAYHSLAVSSIRGESRKTEEYVNDAFKKLWPALGATVLIFLAVLGGLVLFIVPGIIFAAWFSLTFFVMFDENLGAVASMKRSKTLVKDHVFEIIGAYLAGGLISGASLGGGAGLLSPILTIAPMAGRYEQLKALKAGNHPKPELHWMNIVIAVVYGLFIGGIVIFYTLILSLSLLSGDFRNDFKSDPSSDFEQRLEQQLKELEENNSSNGSDYQYNFDTPTYTN